MRRKWRGRVLRGPVPDGARTYYRAVIGAGNRISLVRYWRISDTPKGFWVSIGPCQPMHWTTGTARNRFVDETPEAAVKSLLIRSEYRVMHKERELGMARLDLGAVRDYVSRHYPGLVGWIDQERHTRPKDCRNQSSSKDTKSAGSSR